MEAAWVKWAIWNGLLASGLYFGFVKEVDWLRYATLAFIWVLPVPYLTLLLSKKSRAKYRRQRSPFPLWLEISFDAFALWVLLSTGWLFSSVAYLISSVALTWLHYGRPSKSWIQALIPSGKKSDSLLVIETAPGISEAIFKLLDQQIMLSNIERNSIPGDKKPFVFGYIAGFCDVYSQAVGARGGESLSMTITGQVLERIFGKNDSDEILSLWFQLNDNKDPNFLVGFKTGGEDANFTLGKVPALKLSTYLAHD